MSTRCGYGMMEGGILVSEQKFPLPKLVEVEWLDACGSGGWKDISVYNSLTPMPCKTAGYLLKRNKAEITIALTQSQDKDINQCICIPTGWITKIRKLKY